MSYQSYYHDKKSLTTPKLLEAEKLSVTSHSEQKYGSHPYTKHLNDVITCLDTFGFTTGLAQSDPFVEDIICAAWLHDIVEDTQVSLSSIKDTFGDNVCDIVHRVTDEEAPDREFRKLLTHSKIRGNFSATVVKLADRISNVTESLSTNQEKLKMYKEEQIQFYDDCYIPMMAEQMWTHLRLLLDREYSKPPAPKKSVVLDSFANAHIQMKVSAEVKDGSLQIEDYAVGETIRKMNNGDSDIEYFITVPPENHDAVLLSLLEERFHGNTAYSQIKSWLKEKGISFKTHVY